MTTNPRPSPPTTSTDLETDLLTHLLTTPALDDLHSTLLAALQRTGWTEKIRRLAQELLRGGRCERFDEVIEAVVASAEGRRHPSLLAAPGKKKNGAATIKDEDDDDDDDDVHANGKKSGNNNSNGGNANNAEYFETVDVRIPCAVVEQGVRAIKEVLRDVAVLEGDGDGVGDSSSSAAAGDGGDKEKEKEKEHTTTTTKTPGPKDRVKGVKNGESNGFGASGSPVKKGEKKMKPKQGK
ncbi:uncharacterized protein BO72DRAFT_491739 [Aspergillus fijiensis CBS 313.89]|uniref:Uncharacterized protein n=1 Tax=Aspergillus fijiensis CBS 313.89 TaxID=1448319 RepID=A0A8G1W6B8_9EURO|nr:uncharacterized protein BO72DRAFT_491739 [Aspergillus fijiensis CBS 313.89]RAK82114.1 hypothetical protein BO72DRAFT_491739 [Aspergillus fijiensis CBS 313.89]